MSFEFLFVCAHSVGYLLLFLVSSLRCPSSLFLITISDQVDRGVTWEIHRKEKGGNMRLIGADPCCTH